MVKYLRFQSSEEPFLGRPEARLSSGTLVLAYPIQGEQLLKVHAGKLWPSINRNRCGQASIALHTETKDREARTITRWVKRQVVGGNAPGMRKDEQSQPTLS